MDSQHNDAALKRAHGFKGHINRSRMLGGGGESSSCHVLLRPTWISGSQPRGHWRDLSIRVIELHCGFHTVVISFIGRYSSPTRQFTLKCINSRARVFFYDIQSSGTSLSWEPLRSWKEFCPLAVFSQSAHASSAQGTHSPTASSPASSRHSL